MENMLYKIGAAYVRVSDERQDEYSPDSQLKKIRENAAKDGYTIPDEYVFYDDGISGRSVRKRDDFDRMIAIAKEKDHPFDRIYVWKFSRFARNQEQSIVYKNLLKKNDVYVKSVSETIPEDHFGTLIERVIEWMDEFYLINLSTEVSRGMNEKVSRGEPAIPAPFGYLNAKNTYVPDEESGAADIIREIFQRYADGEKQREIAISLGQRGIRTKRGKLPENRWVEYILWNPAYISKIRWTPDGSKVVSKRDYLNDNIEITDGNWQPLISMELWNKVQGMLLKQKEAYAKYAKRQQPVNNMLKGLLKCSACGGTLAISGISSKKNKTRTFQCCNYAKGTCHTSHSIATPRVERAFIQGLKQALKDQQFTIIPTQRQKSKVPATDYDKLIVIEEKRLERAKEAYLAEVDTIEQYKKNKEEITKRIDMIKAKRDEDTTTQEVDVNAFAKKVMSVVEFIEREDVTEQVKNEALHTIIDKVVYEKANSNLAIYFHDI
jgi:DNA invertase Pin-like site-specific DNA recombinase